MIAVTKNTFLRAFARCVFFIVLSVVSLIAKGDGVFCEFPYISSFTPVDGTHTGGMPFVVSMGQNRLDEVNFNYENRARRLEHRFSLDNGANWMYDTLPMWTELNFMSNPVFVTQENGHLVVFAYDQFQGLVYASWGGADSGWQWTPWVFNKMPKLQAGPIAAVARSSSEMHLFQNQGGRIVHYRIKDFGAQVNGLAPSVVEHWVEDVTTDFSGINPSGRLVATTTANGNIVLFAYDANSKMIYYKSGYFSADYVSSPASPWLPVPGTEDVYLNGTDASFSVTFSKRYEMSSYEDRGYIMYKGKDGQLYKNSFRNKVNGFWDSCDGRYTCTRELSFRDIVGKKMAYSLPVGSWEFSITAVSKPNSPAPAGQSLYSDAYSIEIMARDRLNQNSLIHARCDSNSRYF